MLFLESIFNLEQHSTALKFRTSSKNRKHPEFGQCCGLWKSEIHPAVDLVQPAKQHRPNQQRLDVPRSGHPASFLGGQVKATVLIDIVFIH